MSQAEEQIHEIEISIERAHLMIDLFKSLENLQKNPDFQKLIEQDYFNAEPARLVRARLNPNMQSDESQIVLMKQMDGIASLQMFFNKIANQGRTAMMSLSADEKTKDELNQEQMNG